MKITILTGNFYPEIHPRSFRATELAYNLAEKGHDVDVYLLREVQGFNYDELAKEKNITIHNLALYSQPNITRTLPDIKNRISLKLHNIFRFLLVYLFDGSLFVNTFRIKKAININNDCKLAISLSTPFMNHLAITLYKNRKENLETKFVADSGDPFYRSQQTKRAPYFYLIEKFVYDKFDFLIVPAEASKLAYKGLIADSKIKVIPQGFDLSNIELATYKKNEVITFSYSGVFYDDIRNPKFLLDFLVNLDKDFRFYIYLRHKESNITKLLESYKKILQNKLIISYALKRDELLFKLSTSDFLIDIGNLTTTQIPSKLIDYAITKRPIFSCNSKTFVPNNFMKFFNRDYSDTLEIDLERFDINKISTSFLELVTTK